MSLLHKKITTLVEPLLASLGLELWGLEFLPSTNSLLRIYIERQSPTEGMECTSAANINTNIELNTDLTIDINIDGDQELELADEAGLSIDDETGIDDDADAYLETDLDDDIGIDDEADFDTKANADLDDEPNIEAESLADFASEATLDGKFSKSAGIIECARAARLIGLTLDVEDFIEGSYSMEVSTPGVERLFFTPEQLAAYTGEVVELALHAALPSHPGRKKFAGRVTALGENSKNFSLELLNPVELTPEGLPLLQFSWEDVKKVRLIYIVPEKPYAPKAKQAKQKKNTAKKTAASQE